MSYRPTIIIAEGKGQYYGNVITQYAYTTEDINKKYKDMIKKYAPSHLVYTAEAKEAYGMLINEAMNAHKEGHESAFFSYVFSARNCLMY